MLQPSWQISGVDAWTFGSVAAMGGFGIGNSPVRNGRRGA